MERGAVGVVGSAERGAACVVGSAERGTVGVVFAEIFVKLFPTSG